MQPCPPGHYHPALKSKVVMQPSPAGHYNLTLTSNVAMQQSPPGQQGGVGAMAWVQGIWGRIKDGINGDLLASS